MSTIERARTAEAIALDVLDYADGAVLVRQGDRGRVRFANTIARSLAGRAGAIERLPLASWRVRAEPLVDGLWLTWAEPPRASLGALAFDLANQLDLDSGAIELLLALLDGHSVAEIGRRLGVSRSTVHRRCEALCRCAGTADERQLTEIAEIYLDAPAPALARDAPPRPAAWSLPHATVTAACDALPDALVVVAPSGRVVFVNRAGRELVGDGDRLPDVFAVERAAEMTPLAQRGWPLVFAARHHGRWWNARVRPLDGGLRLYGCRINPASDYALLDRIKRELRLTDRQTDLLRCVLRNASTAETAATLRVSRVTVRRHRSELLAGLGVRTRGQLLQRVASLRE
jgi:DNA-binding CsgD family transcriptional regulator